MSNVKLAIRIRPFTERELKSEKCRVRVVDVIDEHTVNITNIKVSVSGAGDSRERVRSYHVDYTFDSACPATQQLYATQEKVFETVGREVLASVSRGCSACVLAYGQSATGKTHTMLGTEIQPGLVPRLCRALGEHQPFDVTVSFLEIYNERVHDLLAGDSTPLPCHSLPRRRGNARKDLRVREHPSRGPYVQNLRRVAVQSVEALLSLVGEGARGRRTAATRRNSTSSRSHALLEITTPRATLHLADLAGSEKASWEGCGGGRQKEGANINKSLVALSNVISALVSGGNGRGRFIPYRDSALTWLLKDCFTGGASTFIIATVSPSVACYGESASTLRWAARARQLPSPRNVIPGSSLASRAALQAQINHLLAELARDYIRYVPETGKICYDDNHWMLRNINSCINLNKASNIGNIINVTHPKADANTSESTASSVASESSDVINAMDNAKITNAINKEVDKIFSPTLERANSSSDLKVVAPLRHKRRQYRSQEVLPLEGAVNSNQSLVPSQSEIQINDIPNADKAKKPHVSIFYANQRAEIVASVTERLYSKLKKKEVAAVSEMESVVDRKIVEPLSELRICSNARKRLIELSQKAIRNKRRIGIPAYTQTRVSVIRVKDQGTEVQTDLESYIIKTRPLFGLCRDVSTETVPTTRRCKEIAVGPDFGSLKLRDRATATETKMVVYKDSLMMTDILTKNRYTQTKIVPPPRRKKRVSDLPECSTNAKQKSSDEFSTAPVISINISQTYPVDLESQSSDENLQETLSELNNITTPDLLTNHTAETSENVKKLDTNILVDIKSGTDNADCIKGTATTNPKIHSKDFPDNEDYLLPRVTVTSSQKTNCAEIKDMILGRNVSLYPYNILLSPPRERKHSKRLVTFKDFDVAHAINVASQTNWESDSIENENSKSNPISDETISDKKSIDVNNPHESTNSYSTDSSKVETDTFIWKSINTANKTMGCLRRNYMPVYKTNPRYKTAKARLYKDFLGLEKYEGVDIRNECCPQCPTCEDENTSSDHVSVNDGSKYISKFKHRRTFLDDKVKNEQKHKNEEFQSIERKILDSCIDLESSVNKYESYITTCKAKTSKSNGDVAPARTPTEYLQHLIQLRREVVKTESDTTDSSFDGSRK